MIATPFRLASATLLMLASLGAMNLIPVAADNGVDAAFGGFV